jgi:hypothetical protein
MEAQCLLSESIEVVQRFVKQYPHLCNRRRGQGGLRPETRRTASQDLTRVERIAQAVTDVIDGDHGEKNH